MLIPIISMSNINMYNIWVSFVRIVYFRNRFRADLL